MALHDAAVGIPLVTVDGNAFLSALATSPVYDSDVTITLVRSVRSPISVAIVNGPLLVTWTVLSKYSAALPVQWVVVNRGLFASMPVTWTVVQRLNSLPVIWQVIPNLVPDFSADVQMPVGEAEETP